MILKYTRHTQAYRLFDADDTSSFHLEDAIAAYEGTLLVVSHDRYLLDRLAERLLIVGNGRVEDYPGSYSDWSAQYSSGAE